MAKDPAFLFYYQDFLVGTSFMTLEEKGAYITLLCYLADKETITETNILKIIPAPIWDAIRCKFLNQDGVYFNKRLSVEIKKRREFTESRRKNLHKTEHMEAHMIPHMENENENVNKDIYNKGKEAFVLPDWIPEETWKAYLEIRNKKKAAKTVYALNLVIKELQKIKKEHGHNPVDVLNKSIKSGWTDVYPLKDGGNNGNSKSASSFKKFSNSERSLNPEVSERADAITREYLAKKAKRGVGGS